MPCWLRQPWISLRFAGSCNGNWPMTAKRPGYFFAASSASALASGSQLAGGWISAASTPASSISLSNSSAVNFSTLRCSPDGGTTVCDQICTCASMTFMRAPQCCLVWEIMQDQWPDEQARSPHSRRGPRMRSGHGMQADDIAVRIGDQRDIAVLADRELVLHDLAAGVFGAVRYLAAIVGDKIDNRSARPDRSLIHPDERARRPARALVHGKRPHVLEAAAR